MSSYVQAFSDRLDFIEFKQNILLLKNPNHKVSIFSNLSLDKFILIRDLTNVYRDDFLKGDFKNLGRYEGELYNIFPSLKGYPDSYILILKSILCSDLFEKPRTV